MSLVWRAEDKPPEPRGVLGAGDAARALHAALARCAPERLAKLGVTASHDVLIACGPADALPWVEGARYLAPRAEAPELWLPTTRRPSLPLDLVAAAVLRRHAQQPIAVLDDPPQLIPLQRLVPATPELLSRIATRWRE